MKKTHLPDWRGPIGTATWGFGYRLDKPFELVLIASQNKPVGDDPNQLWPLFLTQEQHRQTDIENRIGADEQFKPFLESISIANSPVLCIREKNLNHLLTLLREVDV